MSRVVFVRENLQKRKRNTDSKASTSSNDNKNDVDMGPQNEAASGEKRLFEFEDLGVAREL